MKKKVIAAVLSTHSYIYGRCSSNWRDLPPSNQNQSRSAFGVAFRQSPPNVSPEWARARGETTRGFAIGLFTSPGQLWRSSPFIFFASLHLAEVFPAHPEGAVVLVVLVPYSHLHPSRTRAINSIPFPPYNGGVNDRKQRGKHEPPIFAHLPARCVAASSTAMKPRW